jgi:site-specific recombinase XerD
VDAAALFASFGADRGHPAEIGAIERRHVEEFIVHQIETLTASTAASRYRRLQQFFRFVDEEGEIDASPMQHMSPPAVGETTVPILSDSEIKALLAACEGQTFDDRRDTAIIRLFLDSGIRIAEMAGVLLGDLDLDERVVAVTGKGDRGRFVPFGNKTGLALDRFLRERRRHRHRDSERLWVGLRGPLSTSGIDQLLERRANQAGLKDINAHRFRHTFAHSYLAHGGNEGDLQAIAGWRSPQMLARYGASARSERAIANSRKIGIGDRY